MFLGRGEAEAAVSMRNRRRIRHVRHMRHIRLVRLVRLLRFLTALFGSGFAPTGAEKRFSVFWVLELNFSFKGDI